MIQVWYYDDNFIFTGISDFVDELGPNMADVPILVGKVKPKFDIELNDWIEGATPEEIEEWEQSRITPIEPSEDELRLKAVEESQTTQDLIIDDIIFEVIPSIEDRLSSVGDEPVLLASTFSKKLLNKGESAMAGYLARKIIEGRDYAVVFRTYSYKQYQDEVDMILELEGKADLIKR